jgi:hypothetical protein
MAPHSNAFHTYERFNRPIQVSGISSDTLSAYGLGTIILQSDDRPTSTHTKPNVWYVPGLDERILAKHWNVPHDLSTTLNNNENFVITSNLLTSTFQIKSQSSL